MGLEIIQAAIASRFFTNYPTGWNQAVYPAIAENQPWATSKQPTDKAWCRLCVRVATSTDASVDAKARRVAGKVWLQIFVNENGGSLVAQKMGDEMERIFGRKTVVSGSETLRFERAETAYVAKTDDGWQQHRCTVNFLSDAVTP